MIASLAIVALPAAACSPAPNASPRGGCFLFWGQILALVPGRIGSYLRRAFYTLTIARFAADGEVGFLSRIHDRRAEVGPRVSIGSLASIGLATLGEGCQVASRVSILSGGAQHRFDADGRLTRFDPGLARRVTVGPQTWIGEGVIVMADIGDHCIVGAGAVVVHPVPPGSLVVGNPARFVRRVHGEPSGPHDTAAEAVGGFRRSDDPADPR